MYLTLRGFLLLLVAAPVIASATWLLRGELLAGGYIALALALLGFDWWRAGDIDRFDVSREHDSKLSLGAENPIFLNVRNRLRRKVRFRLRDEPPDEFKIDVRVLEGTLAPRQKWRETYHARPLRRGDYQFGDINLRWRGPLGLIVRQGKVEASGPVKVYPNLLDVHRYELLLQRNRLQELGLRSTRQFGEGTEFERLREYLPDDGFRRINWKATARRNRPITVEYQTERSQSIMAVVDTGRMMQSPVEHIAKLDYVINAVLLLGYVATGVGDQIGMMTFADEVYHYLQPRQGRGQFYRMLELLYAVEAQPVEPNYGHSLNYLALKQRKRALVVIFTDLSGGMTATSLVSHVSLLARRSLPLVVTISDPDIHAASQQRPTDSLSVYQRAAANQVLDERQVALDTLTRRGVWTLDVPANNLSISIINRYLELKGRNLL